MENSSPGKHRRVKRCLFGKPDPDQVEKWLSDTTGKQLKNSQEKWSYDFKLDKPIAGDIEYEAVPMEKVEKWLSDTTGKQLKNSQEKWSYDFKLDKPIAGDIEYEAVPMEKVSNCLYMCLLCTNRIFMGRKKTRKVAEFDPNIPSVSSEEPKNEPDAVAHRPLTRSCTKLQGQKVELSRGLKQAKL
ncbi:Cyclin-dependent kinase inhibitor, partial [Ostertagia ostertagi]